MKIPLSSFKEIFGCDLRTLALFRMAIALILITDLVCRAHDLTAHYTDRGVLPRPDLISVFGWRPSLHLMGGSALFEGILFVIAGLIAIALLVGYRTRIVTVLCWIFLMSLQLRNPWVLQGGDYLLLMLLFWSMFLPLGARFSVDAALDSRVNQETNAYFSTATIALLVQCMSVYLFSALLKSDPAWTRDGTAVYYALQLDHLATPFGVWFRQFNGLLGPLTYYVWYQELLGPFLMFSPVLHFPLRLLLQASFISMHIGFLLCLEIGLFPFVSIASLLAFTPGRVWDKLESRLRTPKRQGLKIYFDGPCSFCQKVCLILRTFLVLPGTPILPAQDAPDIYAEMQERNSWVVVDHDGSWHVRWQALAVVFRRSPIFWPLGRLFALPVFRKSGDWVYETVARNRPLLGKATAMVLPYRNLNIQPSTAANVVVAGLLILVLCINVSMLPGHAFRLPAPLETVRDILRLEQHWNMFAPHPGRLDGWYAVRGYTKQGQVVDVLVGRQGEPSQERPKYLSQTYPTYRWRKYLMGLPAEQNQRAAYARYLCRVWRDNRPLEQTLARLEIYFNAEQTAPNYGARKTERVLLYSHDCAAPPQTPKGLREPIHDSM
jgi:predicted DCC family thiol-disulfide oxidoreductase YuxK